MSKIVTCISIGAYEKALTRGVYYEALDEDVIKKQVKIRGDNGRIRWYPAILFNLQGEAAPVILDWKFNPVVEYDVDDWVEVDIYLTDGTRRWCSFVTPTHLQERLSLPNSQPGFWLRYTFVISSITPDRIDAMLKFIDQQGELIEASHPYEEENSDS